MNAIPTIDIAPLFGPASPERDATDRAILQAAADSGFLLVANLPDAALLTPENRRRLLSIFDLPESSKRRLLRHAFDKTRPNVYRGWFPLQPGEISYKEGIDIGPDLVDPARAQAGDDPLCEASPLPDEAELPGWRAAAAAYYQAMERTGDALTRSLARGLGLEEELLAGAFRGGISSLRLAHYPGRDRAVARPRDPATLQVEVDGRTQWLVNVAARGLRLRDAAGAERRRRAAGAPAQRPLGDRAADRGHAGDQLRQAAGALDRRAHPRDAAPRRRPGRRALLDPLLLRAARRRGDQRHCRCPAPSPSRPSSTATTSGPRRRSSSSSAPSPTCASRAASARSA